MIQYYIINPQTYDDQFWWKKDDIQFWHNIISLYHSKNFEILELAAGTGRLARPLILSGFNYTGLELSNKYTEYATQKLSTNKIIQGDMRSFNFEKKFDMIFIGFNSFLHLLNYNDIKKCFHCIKKHMTSNTKLYIDIFVPKESFLYRNPNSFEEVLEFYDNEIKDNVVVKERLRYIDLQQVVNVLWKYYDSSGKCIREFKFKMKIMYPDTFHRLVEDFNLTIQDCWGSYEMEPFNEHSSQQIYQITL